MRTLRLLILVSLLSLSLSGQEQPQPTQPTPPPPGAAPQPAPPPKDKKSADRKISDKEAKELFSQVDQILKFVSKDTGLPIKHPVKRELASREKVRSYLEEENKNDEDNKRLQRTAIILKKLGLLPRDFDLGKYIDDLLEEQVSGYYDAKTKTVYLLDWVDPDSQKPVLAHELTHALQDQNFDLDKFLRQGAKAEDQSKELKAHDSVVVKPDEPGTARHAIIEGQAMIVLYDYFLDPSGRSVADSPQIVQMLRAQSQQSDDKYPLMSRAPLYLRDSLIFPYTYGMDFEVALLRQGKEKAFAGVLSDPPRNTREVMEPKVYGTGEKIEPLTLPDMRKLLGKDYEPYDIGNLGEFDVHALMKQFAGEKTANRLSPHWRGGAYYAAERTAGKAGQTDCSAKPADAKLLEAQRTSCLSLLSETRWDTPEAAKQFAERYASLLLVKYKFAQSLSDESAKPEAKAEKAPARCFECLGGERWMTDEGEVTIQQQGERVLVLETFDDAVTLKLQQATLPPPSPPPAVHSPQ
ncbi:MAG TPA: hypothetical protein VL382_04665 [Terriglobales bacterium]|nr:hypothetical protein [Terriglobales bacterium]